MGQRPNRTTEGSVAVEATAVVAMLILLTGGTFLVLYLSFTRIWAKSALYDGLICVQENRPQLECRQIVRKRLSYLPFGTNQSLLLSDAGEGRVTLRVHNFNVEIQQLLPDTLR